MTEVYGRVPFPVPRWKPSVGWSDDMDLRSHPDRCKDQDTTRLNLAKQKYVKDAREAHRERFDMELEVHRTITDFLRKPFSMSNRFGGKEMVSEKVAAKKKFLVVHFSHYYQIQSFHYPAEFALAEFSVFNGLGDGVSGLIDIGKIPLGYDYPVRERRKETCNPHPPFDENFHPYQDALGLMENIIRRHFAEDEEAILFTLKEFVPIVMNGMEWLFEQTGKFFNVRILPVSILVLLLINETQEPEYQQGGESSKASYEVQHESQLERYLHDTYYAYSPELACEFHAKPENERGVENCSENNVKRLIYNICKVLSPFYRVSQVKNAHYPIYRAPTPKPTTRNGLKIYEVPNIRRMAEIQRFASSDRMSDLLRSQSHSGLSSLETSSASERSSPSPQESSDSEVGSGSGSYSDESVDTVEMDPPDESSRLKSMFQVEPEFRYGASVNQFLPRAGPAREYSKDRPTYEEAMVDFKMAKQETGKPVGRGRGRGRGMKVAEPQPFLPSFPPVKEDPRPGQFENATNAPRKRPVKISRCFDTQSVRSVSSSGSVRSLASTNSSRSDGSLTTERGSSSGGMQLSKENVMLEPWENVGVSLIGARSSASIAFDSVSTIGGYQVDELHTSEDELTDEGEIESASVAAMKQMARDQ